MEGVEIFRALFAPLLFKGKAAVIYRFHSWQVTMEVPMDDRERIARLEATVEAHGAQFDRIEQALTRLQEHTDRGMHDLRAHTDHGLRDLRDHTDRGFAELRGALAKTTRWMIGILVTYGIAIVGLIAKAAWS